eukprot:11972405-Heterocapsa_arctica.AAC.1
MAAPGDKGKGKGKGKTGTPTNADGQPWYMENGKDTRADKPCHFHPAGTCRLGDKCPWSHSKKP